MMILLLIFFIFIPEITARHFIIDICSYNNSQWCEENLLSVFEQTHDNYHIIYTDDASTDDTLKKVIAFIKKHNKEEYVTIIHNNKRRYALYNHWRVIQLVKDDDIICHVDGDDFFAHDDVLKYLDQMYSNMEDVWMTYGQFIWKNARIIGYPGQYIDHEIVTRKLYRTVRWTPGQLRTFQAWLGKKINKDDLLINDGIGKGMFFPTNSDIALFLPMIEMAGKRFRYIEDILYIYNDQSCLNDSQVNSANLHYFGSSIRKQKVYETLM